MVNIAKSVGLLAASLLIMAGNAVASDMVQISAGSYRPLYLKKDTPLINVKSFQIDKLPVTNRQFAEFLNSHPQWQKGRISAKQAESSYLRQWIKKGKNYSPKPTDLNKPVTNVSWFAANAYCSAEGKHLPTINQWEYVGQASETKKNGATDPNYTRTILDWYADGGRRGLRDVGKGKPNYWGIYDLHGLIWEWTEDFNSSQLSAGGTNSNLFCSGAAVGAADPNDYAAFMRYSIRTTLQAKYVLNNLGFRCAK